MKGRKKTPLKPGHTLADWARLCQQNRDMTGYDSADGTGATGHPLRITMSQVAAHSGKATPKSPSSASTSSASSSASSSETTTASGGDTSAVTSASGTSTSEPVVQGLGAELKVVEKKEKEEVEDAEDKEGGGGGGEEDDARRPCWMVIHGRVYNVAPYLEYHPGGARILQAMGGKDATRIFTQTHAWVNYERLLQPCFIGVLVPEPISSKSKEASSASSSASTLSVHKPQEQVSKEEEDEEVIDTSFPARDSPQRSAEPTAKDS